MRASQLTEREARLLPRAPSFPAGLVHIPAACRLTQHAKWPELMGRFASVIGTVPGTARKPTPALGAHLVELALHDLHLVGRQAN